MTVNAAPSVSSPGNQTVAPGAAVSLDVAGLTTGGTAPLTYSAVNLPSWLTLNTSTGADHRHRAEHAGTTTGIILTVRDSFGVSASSPSFSWTVGGGPPLAPLAVVVVNGDSTVTPSWTAPSTGPVTSYTATVSPGGASCTTSRAQLRDQRSHQRRRLLAHGDGDQRCGHGSRIDGGERDPVPGGDVCDQWHDAVARRRRPQRPAGQFRLHRARDDDGDRVLEGQERSGDGEQLHPGHRQPTNRASVRGTA